VIIQVRTHSQRADRRLPEIWDTFSDLFCREHEVVLAGQEKVEITWTQLHWDSVHLYVTNTRLSAQIVRLVLSRILDRVRRELSSVLGLELAEVSLASNMFKILDQGSIGNVTQGQ
jgi:CRISPR/Cas system-associated protein Csm6